MKRQQLLLLILAFGVFSILNTEMGIIGILPMAAEMYQVDIVQAGMLVSLFALGVAIAGPTMPLLFSRFNRKHVMLLVLGVFTICNALAVVASDFQLLLVLRVVPAFFHPVYCALAFSVAAASVAPEDAPRAVARINMGVAAGMVVGVPISNVLAATFDFSMAMVFFAGRDGAHVSADNGLCAGLAGDAANALRRTAFCSEAPAGLAGHRGGHLPQWLHLRRLQLPR